MKISLKRRYKFLNALRWIARISSVVTVAALILFLLSEGVSFSTIGYQDLIGFLFLPIGLIFGFIIAWKRELLGGLISQSSLLGFYLIYGLIFTGHLLDRTGFVLFSIPSFLFMACGIYGHFLIRKPAERITNKAVERS